MKRKLIEKFNKISNEIEYLKRDFGILYQNLCNYLEYFNNSQKIRSEEVLNEFTKSVSSLLNLMSENSKKEDETLNKVNAQLKDDYINLKKEFNNTALKTEILLSRLNEIDAKIQGIIEESKNLKSLPSRTFISSHFDEFNRNLSTHLIDIEKKSQDTKTKVDEISINEAKHYESLLSFAEYLKRNSSPKVVYKNDFERQTIADFKDFVKEPDYKDKYLALVKGLSPDDINTLNKIIIRQQTVTTLNKNSFDFYSEEEKKAISTLSTNFKANIIEVSPTLFAYKNYLLPINHFEASVFWDEHGMRKLSNKSLDLISNKDILDVGGYIGDSILVLSKFTNKKIISFEPSKTNFKILQETIKLNSLNSKVIAENIGLSNKTESRIFYYSDSSSSFNEHPVTKTTKRERINCVKLDDYLENTKFNIGLIKIDIEGAEQLFLEGAKKTITKYRPILLVSIYHNKHDFYEIKPIIESWNLGYKFKIHKPIDYTISREILLICEPKECVED